jgi:hypothetical protein
MIDHNQQPERQVPSGARGAARRRRVEGGRPRAVKIRFTDAEYEAVAARAADSRVSIQRLLVAGALTSEPATTAPSALTAELAGLRRLVANIANNINQIARKLNSGGRPDVGIASAADAVQRTMRRLDAALGAAVRSGVPEQPVRGPDLSSQGPEPVRQSPVPRGSSLRSGGGTRR